MTTISLNRYDRFVRKISHGIFKIGVKLDSKFVLRISSKLLDHVAERNGCPKGRNCWITRDTIRY